MARYIFDLATGALMAWEATDDGPDLAELLLKPDILSKLNSGEWVHIQSDLVKGVNGVEWDEVRREPVAPPPLPAPAASRLVSSARFLLLFSADELWDIEQSQDKNVRRLYRAVTLSQTINLDDAEVQGGLQYLAAIGIITEDRLNAIRAGQ